MGNCTGDKVCLDPAKDTVPCCTRLCTCGDPNLTNSDNTVDTTYKWCSKGDECPTEQVQCDAKCNGSGTTPTPNPSLGLIQLCSVR
jgi:hypothetical protein